MRDHARGKVFSRIVASRAWHSRGLLDPVGCERWIREKVVSRKSRERPFGEWSKCLESTEEGVNQEMVKDRETNRLREIIISFTEW